MDTTCFPPVSAEFDSNNWDRLGGPEGVKTAFNGSVTFATRDGMLVAIAYRLGEQHDASVSPALMPSNPSPISSTDINLFHCTVYLRSYERNVVETDR